MCIHSWPENHHCFVIFSVKHFLSVTNIKVTQTTLQTTFMSVTESKCFLPSKINTLGTRGWSRLCNRTLAVQKKCAKISFFFRKKIKITLNFLFFLDIPSSYAKILGETNVQSQEIPRSGWKAEGIEEKKEKKKKKRPKISFFFVKK